MAEHVHNTPENCPLSARPTRRTLFSGAAMLALATPAMAAEPTPDDTDGPLATPEDFATAEFEACPGFVAKLGDRAHWMAGAAEWWVTMRLCAEVLERDHIQLSTGLNDELIKAMVRLAKDAETTADYLNRCVEALRNANLRLMVGVSRHLATRGEL